MDGRNLVLVFVPKEKIVEFPLLVREINPQTVETGVASGILLLLE